MMRIMICLQRFANMSEGAVISEVDGRRKSGRVLGTGRIRVKSGLVVNV